MSAAVRVAALAQSRVTPFFVFAIFIVLLSYDVLPNKGGVLNYSDGAYAWPSGGFDLMSTWIASNTGFPFIAQSFATFQHVPNALTSFLFHIGPRGDAYHAYALYYGPLYACMLLMFFLARGMSGSLAYGYFAAVFLLLNNFILEQLLVWPVTYFYCLTGIVAQLYVLWRIHEGGATPTRICASILIAVLAHHPFMFVIHFAMQAFFVALLVARRRISLTGAGFILGGGVAMQAYWLIPFFYNLLTTSVAETHRASGESAFVGYGYTIKYRTLFNLVNYPMALDPRINDAVHHFGQTAFNYAVLALAIATVIVLVRRGSQRLPEMLFLLVLYLFFFNLALGPNSEVTGPAWKWAYANVPGFAFFRSFNRFEILALLSMIMLGAVVFSQIRSRYRTPVILALLAANVASYLIFFAGTFHGMVAASRVPDEYYRANEKYFAVDDGKVILSMPHIPYETYTWQVNDRSDLTNPAMYFMFYFMHAPVIFNQYANFLDRQLPGYRDVLALYFDAGPIGAEGHEKIRRLGVTHVMVHKDRLDTLNRNDRIVPWRRFREAFAGDARYRLLEDNDYFSLFELKEPLALLSGRGVQFRGIAQTKYEILVRGLRGPTVLRFAQTRHPEWKLYPASQPWEQVPESGIQRNRLFLGDIPRFVATPAVDESRHYVMDGYANAWTLDPDELRRTLPPGSYTNNPDGSMDVRLQLYFRPQALLMLGIAATLLVSLACLVVMLQQAFRGRPVALPRGAAPLVTHDAT